MLTDLRQLFTSVRFDLIVLNRPNLSELYKSCYNQAQQIIWTDGAANRLCSELGEDIRNFMPNTLIGDMDSIHAETLEHLRSIAPDIIYQKVDDQDTTDLEKSLSISSASTVVVLTDHSGRLDHTLSAFSAIGAGAHAHRKIYLYGPGNIAFIARDGHRIIPDPDWKYCGILPIFGKAVATTQGLQWKLSESVIEFGGFIDVCNQFVGDATINTDKPLLVTISKE